MSDQRWEQRHWRSMQLGTAALRFCPAPHPGGGGRSGVSPYTPLRFFWKVDFWAQSQQLRGKKQEKRRYANLRTIFQTRLASSTVFSSAV